MPRRLSGSASLSVEKRPTWRTDFVVVALRRGVHAELGRAVTEVVAGPVAETAFHRLKNAIPGRTALLPGPRERALWRQRLVLVVGIVRLDPCTRESNLKIRQRLIHQRPDRRIKAHAGGVAAVGRQRLVAEADVAVQPLGVRSDGASLVLRVGSRNSDCGCGEQPAEPHVCFTFHRRAFS